MQPGVDPNSQPNVQSPPPQQIIHGEIQNPQFASHQQPIVYIKLKYKPERNYRHISYLILGIGILLYIGFFIFSMLGDSPLISMVGQSLCCFSFGIGFILDATFYKGKSNWEVSTGQSNGGSITGMIFDIIFALIAIVIAIFAVITIVLVNPAYL